MKKNSKSYGNLFDASRITPKRLYSFSAETVRRLETSNDKPYSDYLNQLKPATEQLGKTLADIDWILNERKSRIKARNLNIKKIKKTMSERVGHIAGLLGGFDTIGYVRFYPLGVSEYSQAGIRKMDLLVDRIDCEATAGADKLGTELTDLLLSFKPALNDAFSKVSRLEKMISDKRSNRSKAVTTLQYILSDFIRCVGKTANDEIQYKAFFDFNLLYVPVRGKKTSAEAGISTEQKIAVV